MNRIKNILLALLSGLILAASWFSPFTLLIFVGFVPLFIATKNLHEATTSRRSLKVWGLSYLAFFFWNLISTWWIYNASLEGAIMAIVCNALLMSWVYLIWYRIQRVFGSELKFWLLVPLWLAFEYGHTLWDLTWPWLSVGNVFANTTSLVQWYELTGTSGGSLWVLAVNILLFNVANSEYKNIKYYVKPIALVIIPVLVSIFILSIRTVNPEKELNVTVIQPNIDPYGEKFVVDFNSQLNQLHQQLLQTKINANTELVVLPETFIIEDVRENDYQSSEEITNLITLMKIHFPKAAILTGASTYHVFEKGEEITATARKFHDAEEYYDMYNTALYIDTNRKCTFYHKSKLVPGVERMPFPGIFKYFEKYAIELGGTSGSLATQEERTVLSDQIYHVNVAPAVCYESVYGDFMAEYIRKGANIISIITNDGWWGNTPGHRQHLAYAKLRAIETRKHIIRSANTGISCFIDEMGNITQPQPYWEFAVINQNVSLNSVKTFFVRFGDLISYASVFLAALILLYSQFLRFKMRKKSLN